MKSFRKFTVLVVGLCAAMLVAACAGSSTGTGNTGTPAATSAPTVKATAKPKPTAVPHLTLAYCQRLMSLSEMNTIFQPPAPAATIVPTNGDTGGACNYAVSKSNIPLIIY